MSGPGGRNRGFVPAGQRPPEDEARRPVPLLDLQNVTRHFPLRDALGRRGHKQSSRPSIHDACHSTAFMTVHNWKL